jgi:preprotein translocase subunit SecA
MRKILEKLIGNYSERELKKIEPIVEEIESLEESIKKLSDSELKGKTEEFKKRYTDGEDLDSMLPEAFAVMREAACRVLGQRAFKTQLIGGIVLHQGRIAEMKTGEGKTLAATLPVYLNAMTGKGVHVITVNDYLASYQGELMGKVYNFLGLSIGVIRHGIENDERREAYNCDITYGTNNEYGFDYLRDNMVTYKENLVQRELAYAIIDEVDSILIDEARTPLIISGAGDKSTDLYLKANKFARKLRKKVFTELDDKKHYDDVKEDYIVDEKASSTNLTASGIKKAEEFFGLENLSDPENMTITHHINQAIRAYGIMKREKDYVIKDGEIIIVDEFTGRLMYGRRYSNGLHQAIEAKEGVKIARESKTLATITFQNYFRMYGKLAGMTGTAETEEDEFREIYKLDVIVIPTNKPMIRIDHPDMVYKSEEGKYKAVIEDVYERHKKGQPMLIGTISIERSELLSELLRRRGIKHNVLNAKHHDREAEIVAQAGSYGAVTIATNMAGRGTDIMLGGNPEFMAMLEMRKQGYEEHTIIEANGFNETDDEEILSARKVFTGLVQEYKKETQINKEKVIEAGGLCIIGTERHESRRIDNQLRGRSGRQGDMGESRFYISLSDDLMRLFGSDRMLSIVNALRLPEDVPIEHKMLSSAIEGAQKKVESRNFDIRKRVLQYDDVMNKQREVIYAQRKKVLDGEKLKDNFTTMIDGFVGRNIEKFCGESPYPDYWDWERLTRFAESPLFGGDTFEISSQEKEDLTKDDLKQRFIDKAMDIYKSKEDEYGTELMSEVERVILLRTVDQKWMDHIDDMDQLRQGVSMRAYAQRDPVIEYKFEGFDMFEEMINNIQDEAAQKVLSVVIDTDREIKRVQVAKPTTATHGGEARKPVRKAAGAGRNDPCPCGSGKKYKKCCGA